MSDKKPKTLQDRAIEFAQRIGGIKDPAQKKAESFAERLATGTGSAAVTESLVARSPRREDEKLPERRHAERLVDKSKKAVSPQRGDETKKR
jgi:hypothetical protein